MKTNEYYDLIDDADLQVTESYYNMILVCPNCKALFSEKACGMRTIFPWFGYHPTDGNCKVIDRELSQKIGDMADACDCTCQLERVMHKADLDGIIKEIING